MNQELGFDSRYIAADDNHCADSMSCISKDSLFYFKTIPDLSKISNLSSLPLSTKAYLLHLQGSYEQLSVVPNTAKSKGTLHSCQQCYIVWCQTHRVDLLLS